MKSGKYKSIIHKQIHFYGDYYNKYIFDQNYLWFNTKGIKINTISFCATYININNTQSISK